MILRAIPQVTQKLLAAEDRKLTAMRAQLADSSNSSGLGQLANKCETMGTVERTKRKGGEEARGSKAGMLARYKGIDGSMEKRSARE